MAALPIIKRLEEREAAEYKKISIRSRTKFTELLFVKDI